MIDRHEAPAGPWVSTRFEAPPVPTMITEAERVYLHWLGAEAWSGEGCVVEIGPWLGGSTYCLASGLARNPHDARGKYHVYDNFIWRTFMSQRALLPLKDGESFQPYFRAYLRDYAEFITDHRMSLPDEIPPHDKSAARWRETQADSETLLAWTPQEAVEILFIDGAKSWNGMKHLIDTFHRFWIPGTTLLVCQDYKYWGTYWVAGMLEPLMDHLELVHDLPFNTATFRLTSKIPEAKLERIPSFEDLDPDLVRAQLDSAAARYRRRGDAATALILTLSKTRLLTHHGRLEEAVSIFRDVEARWPFGENDQNLESARAWLEAQRESPLAPTRRTRLRRIWTRGKRAFGSLRGLRTG